MQTKTHNPLVDQALLETVLNTCNEAFVITDSEGIILKVNQAFCAISGYSEHEILGHTPRIIHSGQNSARFYKLLWQRLKRDGFWSGQVCNKKKNGELYYGWLKIREFSHQEFGTLYLSVLTEQSESLPSTHTKLEKLHKLAYFDEVTGLSNRNHFLQFITSYLKEQPKGLLALFFIDLDKFKLINDKYGHLEGDWVLKMVAKRIQSIIRKADFASRLGGDEFVVVLSEIKHKKDAFKIARSLLKKISEPYVNDVVIHSVEASIGIAFYPHDADNVHDLLNIADLAMYEAKGRGDKIHVSAWENKHSEKPHLHKQS